MSNYTNTFGGAAKDSANDIILGAQMDTEYDAIATASATKANKIVSGTTDNIMTMDSAGDLKNSTKLITDKADVAGDTYTGVIDQNDATDSTTGGTGSIHTDGGIGAVKEIVTDATFKPLGDTASSDVAAFGYTTVDGAILTGQGSTNDVVLKNDADAIALRVPTGTQNVVVEGTTTHGGNVLSDTDSTDDLGSTTVRWKDIWADTISLTDMAPVIQIVNTTSTGVATTTATTPLDNDSIPLITEGAEFMTRTITPKHANNILKIDVVVSCSSSAIGPEVTAFLCQDAVSNSLAAVGCNSNPNELLPSSFVHYMTAGGTSEITFRLRIGQDEAGTMTFNGMGGGRIYGGVISSSITVTEYKA